MATRVQEHFRRKLLAYKDHAPSSAHRGQPPPPAPTLISFTPFPTYTLGRRQKEEEKEAPSRAELARLQAPLTIVRGPADERIGPARRCPEVHLAPRGGLATYHGPGQAVLWPVMDLRPRAGTGMTAHPAFTVRCYTRLLEEVTIAVLRTRCGIVHARIDPDQPGVWVPAEGDADAGTSRKIAAVGVHLRRHVSGLGTAVNVDGMGLLEAGPEMSAQVDPDPDPDPEQCRPWARFVACGLEGRGVTSVRRELGEVRWAALERAMSCDSDSDSDWQPERTMAWWWAEELARQLGLDGVRHFEDVDRRQMVQDMNKSHGLGGLTGEEQNYIECL